MKTKDEMIKEQINGRGIYDQDIINAMMEVDRADFVPDELLPMAYEDRPLPIGKGQTISQPYIVAYMSHVLDLVSDAKILEIGTGCGYNAAVMSKIVKQVHSIEIVEWLGVLANKNLKKAGITNVFTKVGDGYEGCPEEAPFDAIVLTAAPPNIPEPLKKQLKIGGKLLAPVGKSIQNLILLKRTGESTFDEESLLTVKFVPMTGEAQR
jgi:protein-L-isoaspartate(D-aspartate) O-methyltransferase